MMFRAFSMITLEDAIILPNTSEKMQHLRFSVASMTTLMQRIMCVIKENTLDLKKLINSAASCYEARRRPSRRPSPRP